MNWEDTVMSDEQIDQVWPDFPKEIIDRECPLLSSELEIIARQVAIAAKVVAQAQAEISFKAGIKEVVNWVRCCPNCGSCLSKNLDGTRTLRCSICDWDGQAQLKEWGYSV